MFNVKLGDLYLDGTLLSKTASGNAWSPDNWFSNPVIHIGKQWDPSGLYYPFTGYVDDIQIFNSALSSSQINSLTIYQATLSFDNVNTLTLSDFDTSNTSLVAYYNNGVRINTLSPTSNSINSTIYSSGNYLAQLVNSSNQIIGISNTITSTIDGLSFDGYFTLSFSSVDPSSSIELYKDSVKLSDISTSTSSIQIVKHW